MAVPSFGLTQPVSDVLSPEDLEAAMEGELSKKFSLALNTLVEEMLAAAEDDGPDPKPGAGDALRGEVKPDPHLVRPNPARRKRLVVSNLSNKLSVRGPCLSSYFTHVAAPTSGGAGTATGRGQW